MAYEATLVLQAARFTLVASRSMQGARGKHMAATLIAVLANRSYSDHVGVLISAVRACRTPHYRSPEEQRRKPRSYSSRQRTQSSCRAM